MRGKRVQVRELINTMGRKCDLCGELEHVWKLEEDLWIEMVVRGKPCMDKVVGLCDCTLTPLNDVGRLICS